MSKVVLFLIGLPGSGKTTASTFFLKKKIFVYRMGDLTDKLLYQSKLSINETNEDKLRNALRKKYGQDIYAKTLSKKINKKLQQTDIVVVDGLRSVAELRYFKSKLKHIKLIYIDSDKEIRYLRLINRKIRPLTLKEAVRRDKNEIKNLGIKKLRKYADYIINNQENLDVYEKNLQNIYRQIILKI